MQESHLSLEPLQPDVEFLNLHGGAAVVPLLIGQLPLQLTNLNNVFVTRLDI